MMLKMVRMARTFRVKTLEKNIYTNYTEVPTEEKEKDKTLNVWDRKYDQEKYMKNEGPLKETTHMVGLDVEPFPRMKLMKLSYMVLNELKGIPEDYYYKPFSEEVTKHRMKVVDENENIGKIEEIINAGCIEFLIHQAHNELKLLRTMKKLKIWDLEKMDDESEDGKTVKKMIESASFHVPITMNNERFDQTPKPERPPTSGVNIKN